MSDDPVARILHDPRFQGQPITWEVTPDEYTTIRHAWLTHVSAEERLFTPYTEDEWRAQMTVMLSVFSPSRVMEIVPTGERWEGRDQVGAFYRVFIGSCTGMAWVPQALVIGPQGVLDVANMSGQLTKPFAGLTDAGQQVQLQWVIFFPWLPEEGKFQGERIYSIRTLTVSERRTTAQPAG